MSKIFLKILVCVLFINLSISSANCAQIVYPKSTNVKINSPCTFFIGNENPSQKLKINGEYVKLHSNGAFKHAVDLKIGENIFKINNGENEVIYKIIRSDTANNNVNYKSYKTFESSKFIQTSSDNVPLRSTPVDSGLNRLQHLQKGILFEAVGEENDFYKVKLARDDYVWISKQNVQISEETSIKKSKIISNEYEETDNKKIYKIKLEKKVPFILSEERGLDLVIFNVDGFDFNKYELHIDNEKNFGYSAKYNDDNELVIKINKPVHSLKDLKITIDPGHGGNEFGAIGCLGEKEKDLNLQIALKLREKLKQTGAKVFMTREDDSFVSLYDRVKFANDHNSQIFISIHANALPDSLAKSDAHGVEVYYYYRQARGLASNILDNIALESGMNKNKIIPQSFAVVRNTQNVSILIETGYIIDPQDEEKLLNEDCQNKIIDGIIKGLENYLK